MIEEAFNNYCARVFPGTLPEHQKRELKLCWFAAFASCFEYMVLVSDKLSEDEASAALDRLNAELHRFIASQRPPK